MKIRFWHMWIYRLFYWAWTPLLIERPDIVIAMRDYMSEWLVQPKTQTKGKS